MCLFIYKSDKIIMIKEIQYCVFCRHIFLVEKCRVWGMWEVEWAVRVDDIMAVPEVIQDKLVFKVRQVLLEMC